MLAATPLAAAASEQAPGPSGAAQLRLNFIRGSSASLVPLDCSHASGRVTHCLC